MIQFLSIHFVVVSFLFVFFGDEDLREIGLRPYLSCKFRQSGTPHLHHFVRKLKELELRSGETRDTSRK